eukprot:3499717-Rhodomonas_salina.2
MWGETVVVATEEGSIPTIVRRIRCGISGADTGSTATRGTHASQGGGERACVGLCLRYALPSTELEHAVIRRGRTSWSSRSSRH